MVADQLQRPDVVGDGSFGTKEARGGERAEREGGNRCFSRRRAPYWSRLGRHSAARTRVSGGEEGRLVKEGAHVCKRVAPG